MNPRPEISDNEIDRYMNFPELLRKQHLAAATNNIRRWLWVGSASLMITVLSIWYFTSTPVNNQVDLTQRPEPLPSSSHADTPKQMIEEEMTPIVVAPDKNDDEKTKADPLPKVEAPSIVKKSMINDEFKADVYAQAEPVDGYDALYQYLNVNIKYPQAVASDSTQGVVTVSFIIDKNGSPSTIEATSAMPRVFNDEAIRLIKNMPAWKPATMNGIPVQSKISLPVTFQVQSFQK